MKMFTHDDLKMGQRIEVSYGMGGHTQTGTVTEIRRTRERNSQLLRYDFRYKTDPGLTTSGTEYISDLADIVKLGE
jgi:hypothetical protein